MDINTNIRTLSSIFPLVPQAVGAAKGLSLFHPNTFCVLACDVDKKSITLITMTYRKEYIPSSDSANVDPIWFARADVQASLKKYGQVITGVGMPDYRDDVSATDILRQAPAHMGTASVVAVYTENGLVKVLPISAPATNGMSAG